MDRFEKLSFDKYDEQIKQILFNLKSYEEKKESEIEQIRSEYTAVFPEIYVDDQNASETFKLFFEEETFQENFKKYFLAAKNFKFETLVSVNNFLREDFNTYRVEFYNTFDRLKKQLMKVVKIVENYQEIYSDAEIRSKKKVQSIEDMKNSYYSDINESSKLIQDIKALLNTIDDLVNNYRIIDGIIENLHVINNKLNVSELHEVNDKIFNILTDTSKKLSNLEFSKITILKNSQVKEVQESIKSIVEAMKQLDDAQRKYWENLIHNNTLIRLNKLFESTKEVFLGSLNNTAFSRSDYSKPREIIVFARNILGNIETQAKNYKALAKKFDETIQEISNITQNVANAIQVSSTQIKSEIENFKKQHSKALAEILLNFLTKETDILKEVLSNFFVSYEKSLEILFNTTFTTLSTLSNNYQFGLKLINEFRSIVSQIQNIISKELGFSQFDNKIYYFFKNLDELNEKHLENYSRKLKLTTNEIYNKSIEEYSHTISNTIAQSYQTYGTNQGTLIINKERSILTTIQKFQEETQRIIEEYKKYSVDAGNIELTKDETSTGILNNLTNKLNEYLEREVNTFYETTKSQFEQMINSLEITTNNLREYNCTINIPEIPVERIGTFLYNSITEKINNLIKIHRQIKTDAKLLSTNVKNYNETLSEITSLYREIVSNFDKVFSINMKDQINFKKYTITNENVYETYTERSKEILDTKTEQIEMKKLFTKYKELLKNYIDQDSVTFNNFSDILTDVNRYIQKYHSLVENYNNSLSSLRNTIINIPKNQFLDELIDIFKSSEARLYINLDHDIYKEKVKTVFWLAAEESYKYYLKQIENTLVKASPEEFSKFSNVILDVQSQVINFGKNIQRLNERLKNFYSNESVKIPHNVNINSLILNLEKYINQSILKIYNSYLQTINNYLSSFKNIIGEIESKIDATFQNLNIEINTEEKLEAVFQKLNEYNMKLYSFTEKLQNTLILFKTTEAELNNYVKICNTKLKDSQNMINETLRLLSENMGIDVSKERLKYNYEIDIYQEMKIYETRISNVFEKYLERFVEKVTSSYKLFVNHVANLLIKPTVEGKTISEFDLSLRKDRARMRTIADRIAELNNLIEKIQKEIFNQVKYTITDEFITTTLNYLIHTKVFKYFNSELASLKNTENELKQILSEALQTEIEENQLRKLHNLVHNFCELNADLENKIKSLSEKVEINLSYKEIQNQLETVLNEKTIVIRKSYKEPNISAERFEQIYSMYVELIEDTKKLGNTEINAINVFTITNTNEFEKATLVAKKFQNIQFEFIVTQELLRISEPKLRDFYTLVGKEYEINELPKAVEMYLYYAELKKGIENFRKYLKEKVWYKNVVLKINLENIDIRVESSINKVLSNICENLIPREITYGTMDSEIFQQTIAKLPNSVNIHNQIRVRTINGLKKAIVAARKFSSSTYVIEDTMELVSLCKKFVENQKIWFAQDLENINQNGRIVILEDVLQIPSNLSKGFEIPNLKSFVNTFKEAVELMISQTFNQSLEDLNTFNQYISETPSDTTKIALSKSKENDKILNLTSKIIEELSQKSAKELTIETRNNTKIENLRELVRYIINNFTRTQIENMQEQKNQLTKLLLNKDLLEIILPNQREKKAFEKLVEDSLLLKFLKKFSSLGRD